MDAKDALVDQALASARRRRRTGNSSCEDCGGERHLEELDGTTFCYGCRARRAGERSYEDDHLAGRVTWGSLTVRLRPNDHRTASEYRRVLGFDDLPEADGDPLLLIAHLLAGIATLLAVVVEYVVAWALKLRERHGADYASGLLSPAVG